MTPADDIRGTPAEIAMLKAEIAARREAIHRTASNGKPHAKAADKGKPEDDLKGVPDSLLPIFRRLDKLRRSDGRGGVYWRASCPAGCGHVGCHFAIDGAKLYVRCYGGCDPRAVATALGTVIYELGRDGSIPKSAAAAHGQFAPHLLTMSDVEAVPIPWLWPHRIPRGRITLLIGRPGGGKSFFTAWLAATLSTGRKYPDGCDGSVGDTILLSAEDDPADTIRPRLDACGADCSRVHVLASARATDATGQTVERCITLADLPIIEAALDRLPDTRLVVVDPVGSYLGSRTDAHRDNEVRGVLAPLTMLARERDVAVLVVMHTRKSAGDSADDMALGSRAFSGIARATWHLSRDPEDKDRRLMLGGKNNVGPERDGLAFRIGGEPASVIWEDGPVCMSADDALAAEARSAAEKRKPGPAADKRLAAGRWLAEQLATGPKTPKELRDAACTAGHVWRTVEDASRDLNVDKYRSGFGGGSLWRLPLTVHSHGDDATDTPQGENNPVSLCEWEKQGKSAEMELCGNGDTPIPTEIPELCAGGRETSKNGPLEIDVSDGSPRIFKLMSELNREPSPDPIEPKPRRRFGPSKRAKGGAE